MLPPIMNAPNSLITRVVIRALIPCLLLFTLAILMSRVQASHDSSLSDLLPTADCAAPCFLGIRPGVTSVDTGLQTLRASPLIRSVSPMTWNPSSGPSSHLYEVDFVPTFVSMQKAQMQLVTHPDSGIIDSILLTGMGIQLSQIELAFGRPESSTLDESVHIGLVTYASFYPQYQMYIQTMMVLCAPEGEPFWAQRENLMIGIASSRQYAAQYAYYSDEARQNGDGWQQQLHTMKRNECERPATNFLAKTLAAT
ncbi:MAG TPA: hypothetical protein VHD90_11320 [Phototrophicaceae bacterium]|nr:hypothetical protein [Phototrophicaceae bacterium]